MGLGHRRRRQPVQQDRAVQDWAGAITKTAADGTIDA